MRIPDSGVQVSGFRVQGSGVDGSGFRVQGSGLMVQGSGVDGSGFRVQGSGFRVQGLMVQGSGFQGFPQAPPVRAYYCKRAPRLIRTSPTPESWKRLPKVDSLCKAVVFKSQHRPQTRSGNDPPLSALWRGQRISSQRVFMINTR